MLRQPDGSIEYSCLWPVVQSPHHPIRTRVPLRPPAVEGWDRVAVERFVRMFDRMGIDLNDPCLDDHGGPNAKEYQKVANFMRILQRELHEQHDGTVRG